MSSGPEPSDSNGAKFNFGSFRIKREVTIQSIENENRKVNSNQNLVETLKADAVKPFRKRSHEQSVHNSLLQYQQSKTPTI